MKGHWLAGVCVLLAYWCPPTVAVARAQETVNSASVSGRVTDPQGAAVLGAQVTIRQTTTNVKAVARTDQEGRFRFPYLKVGPYELTVRQPGFVDAARELILNAASAFELPIALAISSVTESVTVTAESTVIEAARTQIAVTVPESEIRSLPMNGRNFLDLALLAPGVSPTNVGSSQLFAETSAVPGAGLSIGSQRNFSNDFIVDGLSANDDAAGLSGIPASVDAIDQFQVVTSGAQAELGRALGGYINVVTKSGTNQLHGDLYGYFRDDRLNAANALIGTTLPMSQKEYGLSIGGPISKDRTFFFFNVERRALDQTGLVTISAPNVTAINAQLAAVGYPGSQVSTGQFGNPVDTSTFMGKLDYQQTGRDQFSARFSQYTASASNSRGAGGIGAPSASAGLDNVDRVAAFGNTLSLSMNTVNETRVQIGRSDLNAPPSDLVGPAVSIQGIATFGTLSSSPTARTNTLFEVADNLSHQTGAHAMRVGVDFLYNDDTITFPRSNRGSYTFSSLASFLSGTYNNAGYAQTFDATAVSQTNPNLGVYAQDEWKLGPALTLNAGLRYDLQFLQTISTDTNTISPRVGIAWSPSASRRTIVRTSVGLFYDRMPLRALANALLSAGNTTNLSMLQQVNVSLSPAQASAPVFPNILAAAVPSITLVNFTTMDRDMQNAYSRQVSAEVERQFGRQGTITVGYQYTRGEDLIVQVNQNVPTCVAVGANNGCRPNPAYANNSEYTPAGSSSYHGLHVSLVQRPTSWGSYRVSYTLSKAMDNVGEFFFSAPIDPFDLNKDWGRSDDDQRHRLVINGVLNTPPGAGRSPWEVLTHGFQVSGTIQYYSALPLNITSGVTTVQGTAGRPLVNGAFIGRNSGTGPDFFSVNARVSRTFSIGGRVKLEGLVEGFNLTNRENVVSMNGNFGAGAFPANPASTFGQITAVGDPRAIQLALRMRF